MPTAVSDGIVLRVAAAARPGRRAGCSPTGRSRWRSAPRSPGSPTPVARAAPAAARRCCAAASGSARRARRRRAARRRACRRAARASRPRSCYGFGLLDVVELVELSERDREPRDRGEVARALLRAVRAPGHRPGADRGERAGAGRPLARAGPAGAARRPVRLAAGDHPRRAARGRARHAGRRGDRAVGAGQRVAAGARPAGAAGGGGRPASSTWRRCRWCPGSCAGWPGSGPLRHARFRCAGPTRTPTATSTTRSAVTLLEEARIALFFDAAGAPTASRVRRRAARGRPERRLPAPDRLPVATRCGWRCGSTRCGRRRSGSATRCTTGPARTIRWPSRRGPGWRRSTCGAQRPRRLRRGRARLPRPGGRPG